MPDRTTRTAALWATAVALPVTVLAAVLLFAFLRGRAEAEPPTASPSSPAVQSTGPVTVTAPALSGRAAAVCRSMVSQLPRSVRDRPARPVTAGPAQNAAYGDPAITVSCGVRQPPVANESWLMSMKSMVAGEGYVCWYTQQDADATIWTTVNREIAVEVTVPSAYEPAAQWANEFSDAILAAGRARTDVPAGCA